MRMVRYEPWFPLIGLASPSHVDRVAARGGQLRRDPARADRGGGRGSRSRRGKPGRVKRHAWGIAIFVAVFSFYLLTQSREARRGATPTACGRSPITSSTTATSTSRRAGPRTSRRVRAASTTASRRSGPSLVHVPGAALIYASHSIAPRYDVLMRPVATHLACAALGALACVVLFGLLCDLGYRKRTASLAAAILALATTTWVYARYPYSEILQLACFTGTFRAVLRCCATTGERPAAAPPKGRRGSIDDDPGARACGSACGPAACSTRSTCSRRRSSAARS